MGLKNNDGFINEWKARCNTDIFTFIDMLGMQKDNLLVEKKEKESLPNKLRTKEAKDLFKKIIELGYCVKDGGLYKWTGTDALYGYFVDVASYFLNVRPSNNHFQLLLNVANEWRTMLCKLLMVTRIKVYRNRKAF